MHFWQKGIILLGFMDFSWILFQLVKNNMTLRLGWELVPTKVLLLVRYRYGNTHTSGLKCINADTNEV